MVQRSTKRQRHAATESAQDAAADSILAEAVNAANPVDGHDAGAQPGDSSASPNQGANQHRRAEYLLDEMAMSSLDGSGAGPARGAGRLARSTQMDDEVTAKIRAEVDSLIALSKSRYSVLPDHKLPPVRSSVVANTPPSAPMSRAEEVQPSRETSEARSSIADSEAENTDRQAVAPAPEEQPSQTTASVETNPQRPLAASWPSPLQGRSPRHPNVTELPPVSVIALEARKLESEIAALYEEANELLANRPEVSGHTFSLLREARTIVLTQPERMGKAEYNIRQVRSALDRAREIQAQARAYGTRLMVYLTAWLLLSVASFALLFMFRDNTERFLIAFVGAETKFTLNAVPFTWAFLAGGIGGVVGAVVSLANHLGQNLELDGQNVVRYLIQPVMGLILGMVVYLLFGLAYNLSGFNPVGMLVWDLAPAVVALAAGLWQEMVYGLIYRLTRLLRLSSRRR
jgi:hypothetical protein